MLPESSYIQGMESVETSENRGTCERSMVLIEQHYCRLSMAPHWTLLQCSLSLHRDTATTITLCALIFTPNFR